jgi:ABC-type branched-subunit amino acid transport system ATPase component
MRALPEALRAFKDYAELVYAGLAVLAIVVLPGGLVSGIEAIVRGLRGRAAAAAGASPERPAATAAPQAGSGAGAAVEVVSVSKHFGSLAAVSSVSLTVPAGRIHGLIGPNGAGKTTLFNIVSGFIEADGGAIRLFGADAGSIAARHRIHMGVARTFQHVAIYDQLSLLDNTLLGLGENGIFRALWRSGDEALRGPDSRRREYLANAALDVVGLYGRRRERAGTLALGDQRRLEIARAIASRPRLLLLDEPVSGVAIDEERKLKDLLHKLNADWSLTMLLIEHNIRFVVDTCGSLSVMHQGALVAEGNPGEVIARRDVQQIYFGKV